MPSREITYREAVREAMIGAMRENEEVFLMGEDVGVYGGAFGVSRGMVEEFARSAWWIPPSPRPVTWGCAPGRPS